MALGFTSLVHTATTPLGTMLDVSTKCRHARVGVRHVRMDLKIYRQAASCILCQKSACVIAQYTPVVPSHHWRTCMATKAAMGVVARGGVLEEPSMCVHAQVEIVHLT
ncbi:unnamed protein product [Ectocarpus sp. 8 AP-2014]